jgi:hypothetical protein
MGNWVYGYLKKQLVGGEPDVWAIQTETSPGEPLPTARGNLRLYENVVSPSTVGQYTGVCDRNGVKIFEGDIVKHYFIGTGIWESTVYFQRGAFRVKDSQNIIWNVDSSCEVIGNIHDKEVMPK